MGAPVTLVDPQGNYVAAGGGGGTSSVEVTNFPATQPVSGTVSVSNFPDTQPVSGTVAVTSLATAGSTQQGAIANAAYTDVTGAANGTMIALLKGIFVQLAIIADNTTPTP